MTHNQDTLLTFLFWTTLYITTIANFKVCKIYKPQSWSQPVQTEWLYCIALGVLTTYMVPLTTRQALTAMALTGVGICVASRILK